MGKERPQNITTVSDASGFMLHGRKIQWHECVNSKIGFIFFLLAVPKLLSDAEMYYRNNLCAKHDGAHL